MAGETDLNVVGMWPAPALTARPSTNDADCMNEEEEEEEEAASAGTSLRAGYGTSGVLVAVDKRETMLASGRLNGRPRLSGLESKVVVRVEDDTADEKEEEEAEVAREDR